MTFCDSEANVLDSNNNEVTFIMHAPYNNIAKCLLCQAPVYIFLFFIYILSLTFLFQSPMQVDDTSGPPAPDTSPPMSPPTPSTPLAGAILIPHFLVSLFSKSFLLFLTLIYFLNLLLYLRLLLALTAVLLRKVHFSFFSLFFFLTYLFTAHTIFHTT